MVKDIMNPGCLKVTHFHKKHGDGVCSHSHFITSTAHSSTRQGENSHQAFVTRTRSKVLAILLDRRLSVHQELGSHSAQSSVDSKPVFHNVANIIQHNGPKPQWFCAAVQCPTVLNSVPRPIFPLKDKDGVG